MAQPVPTLIIVTQPTECPRINTMGHPVRRPHLSGLSSESFLAVLQDVVKLASKILK
jgi:hypothetical protein